VVHEVFTWVWLAELSARHGRAVTLFDVPGEEWDDIARPGIDAVWLMGVWERSPMGATIARANEAMRASFLDTLPDLTDADTVGSAYCVRAYEVDAHLGGNVGLAVARTELALRGVHLILDFVPNHVAPDHEWTLTHPEYFVRGGPVDLRADPGSYLEIGGNVFACGRDPYFPAWADVVQLDTSSVEVRHAMVELVSGLASMCDGVRCDMAMLLLDDVFTRTWGTRASGGSSPDGGRGYWPTVISAVKAVHPDFVFWAEAYWDLEPTLVEQGFDACYDKRLYDRLLHGAPAADVRAHLGADLAYQQHMVRFVENHDEPRAASLVPAALHATLAATVLTLPGVALLHEGGADGRRVHVPVMLGRRPDEPLDAALHAAVDRVLDVLADGLRGGEWAMAAIDGWPDNRTCDRLLAWTWTDAEHRWLVVVNVSDAPADGMVRVPWTDLPPRVTMLDRLAVVQYARDGVPMMVDGLYVALDAGGAHLFSVGSSI
jgi:glycosidase